MHAVVARSTCPSQNVKNTACSDHFLTIQWPCDVQKVHAVVARSTFGSQKRQELLGLSHFLMCQMMSCRWQIDGYRNR